MADAKRTDRLRGQIRECLSEIILRRLKDPHVGMISFTDVQLSRDLSEAKVFYSVYGDAATRRSTNKTLERAKGFLHAELGKMLKIRKVPTLHFEIDKSIEQGVRIQELLEQINKEKDDAATDD